MHDLEYGYVEVKSLVWTPELIQQMMDEMDYGINILSSRKWVPDSSSKGGKWVEVKK